MRVLRTISVLLFGIGTPLAAQTTRSSEVDGARRSIQAGNAAYISAFQAADADAVAQVYDPQGARLNPGGEVIRGRRSIASDVGTFLTKVGPVRVTLETKEIWLVDDIAYETGVWSYTFHPKARAEQRIGGHYVTLWKRQRDGGWKIWSDMGVPGT
jgi:uncharacterized protein (TIGR02246 family)